jgi:hypothetical protein
MQPAPLQRGDIPLGRCNHTATLVGSSILVIVGGWHSDFVDDVYTLDVTSWRWTYRSPKLEVGLYKLTQPALNKTHSVNTPRFMV